MVFAQVRISALNTVFTAIYLVVVLPLFGVHLPLTKTLIGVTFIGGLIPIIGNLISNTAIVIVSLDPSVVVKPDENVWIEFDQERMHLFDGQTEMALSAS